ncbi:MAG: enoyl-CoA hydratase/isomerase family protein [Chloroflexi bacterium]|nr:enoyl-CoA hydratase/isomerase family protein [Chloroflexota bacterium]
MSYTDIQFEIQDEIARIRLNRPKSLNAGTKQMNREVLDAVQAVNSNNIVRVLIISGNGRAFSAGGNLTLTHEEGAIPGTIIEHMEHEKRRELRNEAIRACRVPTIAQVHGYAVGGGFGLLNQCDLIIAAEGTKMGDYATNFGDGPRGGRYLAMMPLRKVYEMVYTGRLWDAEEWYRVGFINRVVPLDKLEEEATAMAKDICRINPLITRLSKESIQLALDIRGAHDADRAEWFIHYIGEYAAGFWSEAVLAKRLQLGMDWTTRATRAGAFRDAETRDRVMDESLKELKRQGGTFTDLESLDSVIKEAVEAVRSDKNWKGPRTR